MKAPKLTRQHFAFIAECIARIPNHGARVAAAAAFVGPLRLTNGAFNRDRFLDACNLETPDAPKP